MKSLLIFLLVICINLVVTEKERRKTVKDLLESKSIA